MPQCVRRWTCGTRAVAAVMRETRELARPRGDAQRPAHQQVAVLRHPPALGRENEKERVHVALVHHEGAASRGQSFSRHSCRQGPHLQQRGPAH